MQLVAVDIGGTHARFALAEVEGGRVRHLGPETVLQTGGHATLQLAWSAFAAAAGPLPRAAAIAIAAPIEGEVVQLTNNPWAIRPALLPAQLGVDQLVLINDFGAVGHAVAQVGPDHLRHLFGPERPLPQEGLVSIVGPGTGLGVAQLLIEAEGYRVIGTEGGHTDFAPLDPIDDAILARLRPQLGRVSVERIVSGPGLVAIHQALAAIEGHAVPPMEDRALWQAALGGHDSLAVAALDRFTRALGAVAGDLALAQGAGAVVLAGGLGLRLADHLAASAFHQRFTAKGRFARRMADLPVKLITHPQPGLFGAAAAFARRYP